MPIVDEAANLLADPQAYTDETRLHAALAELRRNAPVSRVDVPGYAPFWAVTKHADIMAVERANRTFTNWPRPVLMTAASDELQAATGVRTLIHMDDPQHRVVRAIAADWFSPKAMRAMGDRIDQLAERFIDKMRDAGGECDFVQEVAVNLPLYVIMSLLGVPESDFPLMLKLTQELLGSDDDELKRSAPSDESMNALIEMFNYFKDLTESRRAHPTDDLASTIANATIDGEPLSDIDTMSYYAIIATAGHDTTSSSISGGLRALIEHPGQLERLRADPSLMPKATEEIIRWVTPVKGFMRTAAEDATVNGVRIPAGDALLLSYASGNRDEDAFIDPFRFDIEREPNKHVAFGFGVHFCLGAGLARMEIGKFFAQLLPRLRSIELAGEPELMATTFVGGLKHLPIRYRLD
ncbi:cytochrome P450 [Nocardia cyriacigeorgica]|uniref:Cytochrome P450 n=1 Tax=Nocardia cyriacigeorgica TaxID=135487 RepID=A0A5R8P7R1_9NOCA|nr:cytochrome P450 [Nocardia cyriacigeorgica]TLF98271.1 cytochrome P450 [Nocardia cyriacigeorgica]